MNHLNTPSPNQIVEVVNPSSTSGVVLVCEHASPHIPDAFAQLGLQDEILRSHVVWDPGAMGLARPLADDLNAALVAARISRLVYDCNRPPDAPDAMPSRSEVFDIPGNTNLLAEQKAQRIATYYIPFHSQLSQVIGVRQNPILVTIHSFTPVFHGQSRDVEIGVLHDTDSRLADTLMRTADTQLPHDVQRNAPYGPEHGVTHTLREHALPFGHLNVMLEVRNDLLSDPPAQAAMAKTLGPWISAAINLAKGDIC